LAELPSELLSFVEFAPCPWWGVSFGASCAGSSLLFWRLSAGITHRPGRSLLLLRVLLLLLRAPFCTYRAAALFFAISISCSTASSGQSNEPSGNLDGTMPEVTAPCDSKLAWMDEKGHFEKWPKSLILLVPTTGFELVTYRLQGGCSTN
jgi:hypothetical protein